MDTSVGINTEPIKTRAGRAAKTVRLPRRDAVRRKDQVKMDAESIKARGRLNTIIYRKEGGSIKVTLSQTSLDLLRESPEALTSKQCTQEMWNLLCYQLDQHGLVNHRLVKDAPARREMIHEIVEAALEEGAIETITRRSWMTFTLSKSVTRGEKFALVAREGRLAVKRARKAA